MAMGVTVVKRDAWGQFFVRLVEFDFDNSYPANGEAYTLSQLELSQEVIAVWFLEQRLGYAFEHDKANKKIKVRAITAAGGAAAAGTDALSLKAGVVNKEQATAMHGTLAEVQDTADLSALTDVRALVLGF
jgi:hypothetical protein